MRKQGSTIVIIVKGEAEAKKLCIWELQFGEVFKVVERYWNTGSGLVCMTCCSIGHQQIGSYKDRTQKFIICAGPHKVKDHQCKVTECYKGKGKICIYVTPKCANCIRANATNSSWCTTRHKADIKVKQNKKVIGKEVKKKAQVKDIREAENIRIEETLKPKRREKSLIVDTKIELKSEDWVKSTTPKFSFNISDKSKDYNPDYT